MKNSHTPGPWQAVDVQNKQGMLRIEQAVTEYADPAHGSHQVIAWTDNQKNKWDDARLIAAAPELLAALRDSLADYEARLANLLRPVILKTSQVAEEIDWLDRKVKNARAAIAKAEGTA